MTTIPKNTDQLLNPFPTTVEQPSDAVKHIRRLVRNAILANVWNDPAIAAITDEIIAAHDTDLARENAALLALMRRVEPHLDAIICYASTMGEHEPNRIAHDFRAALTQASETRG